MHPRLAASDRIRLRRKLAFLLFATIGLTVLLSLPVAIFPTKPTFAQAAGFQPLTEIPATAQQVVAGVYPITVYNLDIETSTYYVDAYVWFRWQGEIDPTLTVEFINAVEKWGMTQVNILEEPKQLPDGSLYQVMRVEGRFVQPFTLADFPLDEQTLTFLFEDTTYPLDDLVYIADTEDSGYGDTLKIPGWDITGWSIASQAHKYDSQFGETGQASLSANFSVLRYELTIKRPVNFFIWKLLLPLLIVLGANWTALLLHPSLVEVRTAMPATALLTTVFLQQSYSSSLPEVGYLVLLDKIYVLAYLLLIATLAVVITVSARANGVDTEDYTRAQRIDRVALIAQIVVFVVGLAIILML